MLRKLRERIHNEEKGLHAHRAPRRHPDHRHPGRDRTPAFLGQREKGQDSSAKSNARNLVSAVESCFATSQSYTTCGTTSAEVKETSIPTADFTLTPNGTVGYTILAKSKSGNTFTITKTANGVARTCTGDGGCNNSTW